MWKVCQLNNPDESNMRATVRKVYYSNDDADEIIWNTFGKEQWLEHYFDRTINVKGEKSINEIFA